MAPTPTPPPPAHTRSSGPMETSQPRLQQTMSTSPPNYPPYFPLILSSSSSLLLSSIA
ncbi:hypothetical protein N431DRAFT_439784 [Stipitochalara longipes BDJ]|nr:hypothetical protein N431DRAFT_439784 [Stipitochalara longipes BDJ]